MCCERVLEVRRSRRSRECDDDRREWIEEIKKDEMSLDERRESVAIRQARQEPSTHAVPSSNCVVHQ